MLGTSWRLTIEDVANLTSGASCSSAPAAFQTLSFWKTEPATRDVHRVKLWRHPTTSGMGWRDAQEWRHPRPDAPLAERTAKGKYRRQRIESPPVIWSSHRPAVAALVSRGTAARATLPLPAACFRHRRESPRPMVLPPNPRLGTTRWGRGPRPPEPPR
jgi:hypothetical protein